MKKVILILVLCVITLASCNGLPERVKKAQAENTHTEKVEQDTTATVKPVANTKQNSAEASTCEPDLGYYLVVAAAI